MTFAPLPDKKYRLVLCDPPWLYRDGRNKKSAGMARSAYECLPLETLKTLPVASIADTDCKLALWATLPKLPEAIELLEAWGFRYATVGFVWVKLNPSYKPTGLLFTTIDIYSGLGHYTNANAEVVLFGTKGKHWRAARNVKQVIFAPRGKHSAKPPEVRDRLVRLYGNVERIELFAREHAPGWDAWGDQAS